MNKGTKAGSGPSPALRQAAAADIRFVNRHAPFNKRKPKPKASPAARKDLSFRFEALVPAQADRRFERRIAELMKEVRRLANEAASGGSFKKIWVDKTMVKRHARRGHWVYRPIGPFLPTKTRKAK